MNQNKQRSFPRSLKDGVTKPIGVKRKRLEMLIKIEGSVGVNEVDPVGIRPAIAVQIQPLRILYYRAAAESV